MKDPSLFLFPCFDFVFKPSIILRFIDYSSLGKEFDYEENCQDF